MEYVDRIKCRAISAIGLVIILCSINLTADTPLIKGEVTASDGRSLPGVTVYGNGGTLPDFVPEVVKTDENGSFHLEKPVKIIHFWLDGFRPLAVKVKLPASEIKITLEDELRSSWTIPPCPNSVDAKKMIGYREVNFLIPAGAKLKKQNSDEGASYSVYLPKQPIPVELSWAGLIGSPYEDDVWIMQSLQFSERWIKNASNHPMGVDSEGETNEGKRWRHSMFIGNMSATYAGISGESEKEYDALIDSACTTRRPKNLGGTP